MQKIQVKCLVFVSSCIRPNSQHLSLLIESIKLFLRHEDKKIIILKEDKENNNQTVLDFFNHLKSFNFNNLYIYDLSDTSKEDIELLSLGANYIQENCYCLKNQTITVGINRNHLSLKHKSNIHFHIGKEEELMTKIHGLIPLIEQYEMGLHNILLYFASLKSTDELIDYNDLIQFVKKSINFYRSEDASQVIYKKSIKVVENVLSYFQNDILAIFGAGFPFYIFNNQELTKQSRTPNSILNYLQIQYNYFNSKCISEDLFLKNYNSNASIKNLKQNFNLEMKRNNFDIYEYEKLDRQAPLLTRDNLTWQEYYAENCFDLISDIWPCHYCSLFQNQNIFPKQLKQKDMDISCLSCKQTTFLPRNIMGCSTDIDLILVVKNNLWTVANNIKDYIVKESPFYIYDTNFIRTIKDFDGPIDVFVTDLETFINSLKNILYQNNWINTTLYSIALWLPVTEHKMNFGADFVVAFEPLSILDSNLEKQFRQSRKKFADKYYIDEIIGILYESSFYHQQLLSNKSILENIEKKLSSWKNYTF